MCSVCVSRPREPNIVYDAQTLKGKFVKNIRKMLGTDDRLWIRTPHYMTVLHDNEEPLARCPSLILTNKPGQYDRPKYGLFAGLKVSDEVVFLFFKIFNNTAMKMPRFTVTITKSDIEEGTVATIFEKGKLTLTEQLVIKEVIVNGKVVDPQTPLRDIIIFTANFPTLALRVEATPDGEKRMKHRINIITEIIETEETYLNDLSCLLNFWRDTFAARNMMNEQELNVFFKDIPAIMNCHEKFLSVVKQANRGYKSKIGPLFVEYAPYFKVSAQFVAGYPNMLEVFNQKKQGKAFVAALEEVRKMNDGRDFLSYLVTPVQRLPRYSLFLKEMLKYTPMGHPDSGILPLAFDRMEEVNCEIDGAARLEKERNIFAKIQDKLRKSGEATVQMVKAGRRIITTANVSVSSKHKVAKTSVFYVCNDILFMLSDRGRNTKLLFRCEVQAFHYTNVAKDYRSICVVHYKKEKEKIVRKNYTVIFASGEEKATVLDHVDRLQHDYLRHCNEKVITWTMDPLSESVTPLCHQAAVGNGEYIVFFGGLSTDYRLISGDFFTYRHEDEVLQNVPISQMTVTESKTPGRYRHTLTYMDGRLYIIGGIMKPDIPSYVIEFDLDTKTYINACKSAVISRYGHTCNAYNGKLYVFGGKSKANVYYNDVLEVDPVNKSVKNLEVGDLKPEGRCDHSTVLYKGSLVVFGGKGCKGVLGDLWAFDIERTIWKKLSTSGRPEPRRGHLAILLDTSMVIIGGVSSGFGVMRTMAINLSDWRLTYVMDVGNFPLSLRHASGAVMSNMTIIIYGGLEYKSRTPQNTIYRLQLKRRWKTRRVRFNGMLESEKWDNFLNSCCCHTIMSHKSTWVPTRAITLPKQTSEMLLPIARKVEKSKSRRQQYRASLSLSSPEHKRSSPLFDGSDSKGKRKISLQLSHDEKMDVSIEKLSEESDAVVFNGRNVCSSLSMPGIPRANQDNTVTSKSSDWKTLPLTLVQRRMSYEGNDPDDPVEQAAAEACRSPRPLTRTKAKTIHADGKKIPVSAMAQVPQRSANRQSPKSDSGQDQSSPKSARSEDSVVACARGNVARRAIQASVEARHSGGAARVIPLPTGPVQRLGISSHISQPQLRLENCVRPEDLSATIPAQGFATIRAATSMHGLANFANVRGQGTGTVPQRPPTGQQQKASQSFQQTQTPVRTGQRRPSAPDAGVQGLSPPASITGQTSQPQLQQVFQRSRGQERVTQRPLAPRPPMGPQQGSPPGVQPSRISAQLSQPQFHQAFQKAIGQIPDQQPANQKQTAARASNVPQQNGGSPPARISGQSSQPQLHQALQATGGQNTGQQPANQRPAAARPPNAPQQNAQGKITGQSSQPQLHQVLQKPAGQNQGQLFKSLLVRIRGNNPQTRDQQPLGLRMQHNQMGKLHLHKAK